MGSILPERHIERHNHVLDCIEYRGTGFPIIGPQRIGKTRSIGATRRLLRSSKPSLPVVTLIAEHTTVPSKREFFTGILRQLRYVFYSSSSANALSSTLSDLLIQSANEKHSDCILVFIDNAHELKEPQYHWLCDVFNKLDESDITLITLLVGELHLDNSRTAFQKGEHRQISGRFFNDSFRFHGITSRDDACACLSAYDGARFPMNGGPTFTEEYFPEAFATGWRLQNLAEGVWKAFAAVAGVSADDDLEIPMQYFCNLVRRILKAFGPGAGPDPNITEQMLEEAIILTGFRSYRP